MTDMGSMSTVDLRAGAAAQAAAVRATRTGPRSALAEPRSLPQDRRRHAGAHGRKCPTCSTQIQAARVRDPRGRTPAPRVAEVGRRSRAHRVVVSSPDGPSRQPSSPGTRSPVGPAVRIDGTPIVRQQLGDGRGSAPLSRRLAAWSTRRPMRGAGRCRRSWSTRTSAHSGARGGCSRLHLEVHRDLHHFPPLEVDHVHGADPDPSIAAAYPRWNRIEGRPAEHERLGAELRPRRRARVGGPPASSRRPAADVLLAGPEGRGQGVRSRGARPRRGERRVDGHAQVFEVERHGSMVSDVIGAGQRQRGRTTGSSDGRGRPPLSSASSWRYPR